MKKILLFLLFSLFLCNQSFGAGKITELTADATPGVDSLIETVDAPGTVPVSRKSTIAQILANETDPKVDTSAEIVAIIGAAVYEPSGVAVADITDATANGRSLISSTNYASMRGLLDLEAGTDFYSMTAADTAFEAELDNSAGLLVALSDETGTGVAVFNDSPSFADDIIIAATGVKLTGSNGSLTLLGLGDGQDEDIKLDLNTTANTLLVTSPTSSLATIDFGAIGLKFNNDITLAWGTNTFKYDSTTSDFIFDDDINISDTTPHLSLWDTEAGHDDFELRANASSAYFNNVSDSVTAWKVDGATNKFSSNETFTKCVRIGDLIATDDSMPVAVFDKATTIIGVGGFYQGTGTTVATITLKDGAGNAMTITGTNPTLQLVGTDFTYATVTAGNTINSGEAVLFDVTNTTNPTTDDYVICVQCQNTLGYN